MRAESGSDQPVAYLCQRLQDALAQDARVSTLGLQGRLIGRSEILVRGQGSTPGRRDAVAQVTDEQLPGLHLHNEVVVTPVADTAGLEELP